MKLPLFKKQITWSAVIKLVLAFAFTSIAAVIIIPNIDYQEWFPSQLGTYDFTPSIDFNEHKSITLDLSDSDHEEWEIRKMMTLLHARMSKAGITESQFTYTPGEELVIRMPASIDEMTAYALTAKGELEFQTPKEGVDFENDPMQLFDPENFLPSDLDYSDITSASISQVTDQFTYIEITLKEGAAERWADYSAENTSGNFGLTIDGMIYQAWLMPANPAQNTNPNIIIADPEPKSLIVFSYLADGPLPTDSFYPEVKTEDAIYGGLEITRLALAIIVIFALGILARFFIFKEKTIQIIATGLIIIGAIAMMKILSMPLSIALFVGIALVLLLLLLSPSQYHLGLLALLGIVAATLIFSGSTDIQVIGSSFMVFSGFGLISIFFLIFFDAYAN